MARLCLPRCIVLCVAAVLAAADFCPWVSIRIPTLRVCVSGSISMR